MIEPIWEDGEPANDAAALADALEWLVCVAKYRPMGRDTLERLERCIADIRTRLPVPANGKDADAEIPAQDGETPQKST